MEKTCKLPDCGGIIKPGAARGYCVRCYSRWLRTGNPNTARPKAEKYAGQQCVVDGCSDAAKKKELCNKHYMQLPEQRARKAEWYQANQELSISRAVEWEKNNPESRAATNAQRRFQGSKGMDDLDKELSISYRRVIKNNPCFYCGDPGEHYDHFISLVNGGTDHWWNLVRSCARCNHSKNRSNGDEFLALIA